mgnify:CR=1 FL=1
MSTIKDNKYIWIAFWMWLSFLTPAKAASGEIDVQDIVFSHIQDAYTWHITEWNGQEIAIPLPILVKIFPFCASDFSFLFLILAHLECPDIVGFSS